MPPEDVFVVRSAPRIEKFLPGPGDVAHKKGADILLGYVGVIGQQEGMDLLVQAADHLIRKLGHTERAFRHRGLRPAGAAGAGRCGGARA